MTIETLCRVITPPKQPIERGNDKRWAKVEQQLGTTLPDDYKQYINTFGTGKIGEFLLPFNPFSKNQYLNLIKQRQVSLDALKEFYDETGYTFPLYPTQNGLLPWGVTDNGSFLFWLTKGQPDAWTVVINESRSPGFEQFDESMTDFLAKLITGEIVSKIIPSNFLNKKKMFKVLK